MIDILNIGKDIEFSDYQTVRVENLFVEIGRYPYYPSVGSNTNEWIFSKILYDKNSYENNLSNYLKSYEIPVSFLKIDDFSESILDMKINIELNGSKTVSRGI